MDKISRVFMQKFILTIYETELAVNRTTSVPKSVLRYLKDKGQYFGLEIFVEQICLVQCNKIWIFF